MKYKFNKPRLLYFSNGIGSVNHYNSPYKEFGTRYTRIETLNLP